MKLSKEGAPLWPNTIAFCVAAILPVEPVWASAETAEICKTVAAKAASETEVPLAVLLAISLTETGRKRDGAFQPWPWTVNMEGKGLWFATQKEAYDYAIGHFNRGARSFDVGCFQINYKWHGRAFDSVEAMFDPLTNARYAAKHLAELFEEKGNWQDAAGAYHSRTPKYANRYKERFARIRAQLDGAVLAELVKSTASTLPKSHNAYPLLKASSGTASAGSLFAQSQATATPLLTSPLRGLF